MAQTISKGPYVVETEIEVPDGVYQGSWGGYLVRMQVGNQTVVFKTEAGIRTSSASVTIRVANNIAYVSTN